MDGGNKSGNVSNEKYSSYRRSPYAVLNLSQSSLNKISNETIRDSYKRLSRLLHPDKRPPGKERDDAQELFIELQHACKYYTNAYLICKNAYDMHNSNAVFSYSIKMKF